MIIPMEAWTRVGKAESAVYMDMMNAKPFLVSNLKRAYQNPSFMRFARFHGSIGGRCVCVCVWNTNVHEQQWYVLNARSSNITATLISTSKYVEFAFVEHVPCGYERQHSCQIAAHTLTRLNSLAIQENEKERQRERELAASLNNEHSILTWTTWIPATWYVKCARKCESTWLKIPANFTHLSNGLTIWSTLFCYRFATWEIGKWQNAHLHCKDPHRHTSLTCEPNSHFCFSAKVLVARSVGEFLALSLVQFIFRGRYFFLLVQTNSPLLGKLWNHKRWFEIQKWGFYSSFNMHAEWFEIEWSAMGTGGQKKIQSNRSEWMKWASSKLITSDKMAGKSP